MFEYLKPYVGIEKLPNCFLSVGREEVENAERRLGFEFPDELRTLYLEIGCGFLTKGSEDHHRDPSLINRIIPPTEVASILLEPDHPLRPEEGFAPDALPFFDIGETTYLILLPRSRQPRRVYWPDGRQVIAESLQEFLAKLYR